jgi:hypothetical protein
MKIKQNMSRRNFLATSGALLGSALATPSTEKAASSPAAPPHHPSPVGKQRQAIVLTGSRGTSVWGHGLMQRYPERVEPFSSNKLHQGGGTTLFDRFEYNYDVPK